MKLELKELTYTGAEAVLKEVRSLINQIIRLIDINKAEDCYGFVADFEHADTRFMLDAATSMLIELSDGYKALRESTEK